MTRRRILGAVSARLYECPQQLNNRAGSTTVYPFNDTNLKPVELGASIFVKVNKNLYRASEEFNLERIDFEGEEAEMGIWDGEKFLLTVSFPSLYGFIFPLLI